MCEAELCPALKWPMQPAWHGSSHGMGDLHDDCHDDAHETHLSAAIRRSMTCIAHTCISKLSLQAWSLILAAR